jgi:glycosyltransferase involved in cell wall biosynthesis
VVKIQLAMCVYNKEKYVAQAIQSVIDQTFQDWHLTVLENASTDCSADIVNSFKDPRITVINSTINLGQSPGLLKVLKEAEPSEYVGWIDADDFMHPECLRLCYETANPGGHNFVYTAYQDVDEQGNNLGIGYRNEIPYHINKTLVQFICHHFRLISHKLYQQVGGVDSSYRMAEVTTPYKVPYGPLYFYRQYPDSDGANDREAQNTWAAKAVMAAIIRRGLENKIELNTDSGFTIRFKPGFNHTSIQ